ncbi:helix-turn-helix domain-containing protein [Tenacibaculum sp. SG-28]|uniref:winged helix-turn-helix transcriptional regulator n=1 Tax=Tenacibaculum sp. SG-28 TaxID=754426 RepID=UPI000CF56498|nr:helix-turn-helix domain-containing protein [Tenacibaculum sp. SG-28]PQJ19646.1 transcriptional regulator [Tenacibaculum sp. SG-28]
MRHSFRCGCPVTTAIDVLGDKWTLVIIKQMLLQGKQTFKDFTESEEAIATNILSSRMKKLLDLGLVLKTKLPSNHKTIYYHLTEKGISLAPIIIEMVSWGNTHLREFNPSMISSDELEFIVSNKEAFIENVITNYKKNINALLCA